mgnify:FL=1
MKSLRGQRLSSEYQKAVYEVISTKLKYKTDKIRGIVSVIKADVSPDLKNAKIYISVLAKNADEAKGTFVAISENAGFIRHELAHMMQMRTVPELHFFWDETMEYGDKIDRLIKEIHKEDGDEN